MDIYGAGVYEVTKSISDQLVIDASNESKFSYLILKPSNVLARDMPNQSVRELLKND